jgi:hypothetical protein
MANETYDIVLTESQVKNLIEFFQFNFIESVRSDEDIDNIEYLCDMCNLYQTLKGCVGDGE